MRFDKRVNGFLVTVLVLVFFFTPIQAYNEWYVSIVNENPSNFYNYHTMNETVKNTLANEIKSLNINFDNKQVLIFYHVPLDRYYLVVRDTYIGTMSTNYLSNVGGSKTNIGIASGTKYVFNGQGVYQFVTGGEVAGNNELVYSNGLHFRDTYVNTDEDGNYCLIWETFSSPTTGEGMMVCSSFGSADHQITFNRTYIYLSYIYDEVIESAINPAGGQTYSVLENINQSVQGVDQSIQGVDQSVQSVDQSIKDMDSTIKDENISGASGTADSFFSGFETDFGGLTSIITAPLVLINSLTAQCESINLPLGIVSGSLSLPCMGTIYTNYFGSLFNVYRMITDGMIAYWVVKSLFGWVQDFKNPESSKVEVVDL